MRLVPIAAATGLTIALISAGASVTALASSRHSHFTTEAQSLQREWATDLAEGVPASSITPLRAALTASADGNSSWWSPHWWGATGQPLIDQLHRQTAAAWTAAMSAGREQAQAAVDAWTTLDAQLGSFVPAAQRSDAATWAQQIATASTPAELQRLARHWLTSIGTMTSQAKTAQLNAQLNAQVAGYGGVAGLLADAQQAVSTAQGDNLDTGQVPSLIALVQNQYQSGSGAALDQLVAADTSLHSLISLNDSVNAMFRPIELSADQAAAEGTPNASSFLSQYSGLQGTFHDATNATQITAVQTQLTTLQSTINQELAADACGHNVGSGKVITINLTLQEGVFWQDGCAVKATPVTTGRPLLRTPTGHFSIFYKTSPFKFVSPWPITSPFYYVPTWTSWVMEFAGGGYFIHDAWWEPSYEYGPGGENSAGASHGCIHIPTDVMQWLYSWTPMGTPVIITN